MNELVRKTAVFRMLRSVVHPLRVRKELSKWAEQGLPLPPPHFVKQSIIRAYARQFGTKVLVETGTYMGAMVDALQDDFDHIISIELGRDLYEKAKEKFQGNPKIELIHGDSGEALKAVLPRLTHPTLFWLDAHWSGGVTAQGQEDTPIRNEVELILASRDLGHVILIDDARDFGTDAAYPTIEELKQQVLSLRSGLTYSVDLDIIRILPRNLGATERQQPR